MSIRLPFVVNSTPDSVQSKLSHNDKDINKYIWKFRNKEQKGIHVYVTPVKVVNIDDFEWEVEIYGVEWTGNDYKLDNKPMNSYMHSEFDDAISCAEESTRQLSENNTEYSHLV
jgi:hypothetical protein